MEEPLFFSNLKESEPVPTGNTGTAPRPSHPKPLSLSLSAIPISSRTPERLAQLNPLPSLLAPSAQTPNVVTAVQAAPSLPDDTTLSSYLPSLSPLSYSQFLPLPPLFNHAWGFQSVGSMKLGYDTLGTGGPRPTSLFTMGAWGRRRRVVRWWSVRSMSKYRCSLIALWWRS